MDSHDFAEVYCTTNHRGEKSWVARMPNSFGLPSGGEGEYLKPLLEWARYWHPYTPFHVTYSTGRKRIIKPLRA